MSSDHKLQDPAVISKQDGVFTYIYIYLGVMSDTTNVLLFSWNRKPLQHRCLYCQHNVGNYTFERGKIEEGVQFDMHCT